MSSYDGDGMHGFHIIFATFFKFYDLRTLFETHPEVITLIFIIYVLEAIYLQCMYIDAYSTGK